MLLTAFISVLVTIGLLLHLIVATVLWLLGEANTFTQPATFTLIVVTLIWLVMIVGSVLRLRDVRAGGAVLARRYGAVHASDRSRHEQERILQSVVAEMAMASGTAQPEAFVLRHEDSVNAFVLGHRQSRPVIVVTAGALDAFDRDQLQAVVAHEFAHISNGDLSLNMRLLVFVGGLMVIDEIGHSIKVRNLFFIRLISRTIGRIVCALGKIGVLPGRVISAAFSRQREFLADAIAVQFTDNPFALAHALDIIATRDFEPALHGVHARELAHLCFQSGMHERGLRGMLATHPDVASRIQAVKTIKTDSGSFPRTVAVKDSAAELPFELEIKSASLQSEATTERLTLLLAEEPVCLAALFALFVPTQGARRNDYLSALAFSFNDVLADRVKAVMQRVPDELVNNQVGVIAHAASILRPGLSFEHRQKLLKKMEQLLSVHGSCNLLDFARVQLIRRHLDVEFPIVTSLAGDAPARASARKTRNVDAMGEQFALLLSLMVEVFVASRADRDRHFNRVLKCYTQQYYPRRTANDAGIFVELDIAFQALYVQPQSIRLAFLRHGLDLIRYNDSTGVGRKAQEELAQLDMLAASLRCDSHLFQ